MVIFHNSFVQVKAITQITSQRAIGVSKCLPEKHSVHYWNFHSIYFFIGQKQLWLDSGQQIQHISSEIVWGRPDIACLTSKDIWYIMMLSFLSEYSLSPVSNAGFMETEYAIFKGFPHSGVN